MAAPALSEAGFDGSCSMIPLDCDEGRRLLEESNHKSLVPHFCKQDNRTYCSLRSIAICINGMLENAQERFHQNRRLSRILKIEMENGTIGEEDVLLLGGKEAQLDMGELQVDGMTLSTLGHFGTVLGLQCTVFHAMKETNPSSDASVQRVQTLDEFRSTVVQNLQKDGHFVVVNYNMGSLGYKFLMGHFSPIGGYHPIQDRFLVLDVWPDTPAVWVKAGDLFDAMKGVDSSSGMPRGFCVLA